MATERLQKILSNAGAASRRQAESFIVEGRVAVNGKVVNVLGARANPETDEITLDGVPVIKSRYRYLVTNKPAGVITSTHDPQRRKTVLDLLPRDMRGGLHPVGRLDRDSTGLLLLTNDGRLTDLLTHPRNEVEKEYLVGIHAPLAQRSMQQMVRGVSDDGETLRAASVATVSPPRGAPLAGAWLVVTLRQGKKREVRRLLAHFGKRVVYLERIRVGPLHLGDLPTGETRSLTDEEVDRLYQSATAAQRREIPVKSPVAIDGTAGSGKSTLATGLAERFGYEVLDTGLLYRAVAFLCLRASIPAANTAAASQVARDAPIEIDANAVTRIRVGGDDISDELRSRAVEAAVSEYSKIPGVRDALLARQRIFASRPRTILVGRDIGTVVLPDAPVKLYLEASPEARATRRSQQASEWGVGQDAEAAHRDIVTRDAIDSAREASPMRPAADALVIDTTDKTPDEVLAVAVEAVTCADS